MSDRSRDQAPPTFFELYKSGQTSAESIDDWVGRWHDSRDPGTVGPTLPDYLGLTVPEYQVWVCDADALPYLRDASLAGRPVDEVVREHLAAMITAGRPGDGTVIRGLQAWLTMHARGQKTAA